jgi:Arc/MetJ family transcription regulator
MARPNIDIDDAACAVVMKRYHLTTKRAAVNFALRALATEPFDLDEARGMRGSGWDGDLADLRADHVRTILDSVRMEILAGARIDEHLRSLSGLLARAFVVRRRAPDLSAK